MYNHLKLKLQNPNFIFCLLAILLPIILPFARRAAPIILISATLLFILNPINKSFIKDNLHLMIQKRFTLAICFFAYATITLFWSPVSLRALNAIAATSLILFCTIVLYSTDLNIRKNHYIYASISLSIASLIIILDLNTGQYLLHLIHNRPESYRYNMVIVSLIIISFIISKRKS